jgi:hypothetical protein
MNKPILRKNWEEARKYWSSQRPHLSQKFTTTPGNLA